MSKQFEELSKNLAGGMSRRKAFARFAAGIGAAIGVLALPRAGHAIEISGEVERLCERYCRDTLRLRGEALDSCVLECDRMLYINK
jgi:hypothetical protein